MSLGLKTAEYLLLIVDRPRFELGTEACKATVLANYTNSPIKIDFAHVQGLLC